MNAAKTILLRTGLILVALALALATLALPAAAETRRYTLPGDAVFPEGIAYQAGAGDFFVSSNTDGTIFRGNVAGDAASVFLPAGGDGRTSATGMKVDSQGRLFISGAATGQMFVYDIASKALIARFADGKTPTFINDVTVTPAGVAYFTDSNQPVLYRLSPNGAGGYNYEEWLNFTGTPLTYGAGFNLNGIASSADGQHLVVVQSNTGKLFHINTATKAVQEINLGADTLTAGDGIFLRGNTLWVSRNAQALIVTLDIAPDWSAARVVSTFTDPGFQYPTTIAVTGSRLLAVNSQFDKRGPGLTPQLPFNVVAVDLPAQAGGATPGMPSTGAGPAGALAALTLLAAVALSAGAWLRRRRMPA
jgi:sugar lactone lactonase YvrE